MIKFPGEMERLNDKSLFRPDLSRGAYTDLCNGMYGISGDWFLEERDSQFYAMRAGHRLELTDMTRAQLSEHERELDTLIGILHLARDVKDVIVTHPYGLESLPMLSIQCARYRMYFDDEYKKHTQEVAAFHGQPIKR